MTERKLALEACVLVTLGHLASRSDAYVVAPAGIGTRGAGDDAKIKLAIFGRGSFVAGAKNKDAAVLADAADQGARRLHCKRCGSHGRTAACRATAPSRPTRCAAKSAAATTTAGEFTAATAREQAVRTH